MILVVFKGVIEVLLANGGKTTMPFSRLIGCCDGSNGRSALAVQLDEVD